jgi:hypothetical protein
LKIQQLEDVERTISVTVTFHLPIRDGASREPLPTAASPLPEGGEEINFSALNHGGNRNEKK